MRETAIKRTDSGDS